MKRAEVVVTGATGFIGQAVCGELRKRGHSVVEASRARYPGFEGLEVRPGSFCIHLAGENRAGAVARDSRRHLEEATRLARRLLALPFEKIVFASSAGVYGYESDRPHREGDPVRATSPYGELKLAVEELMLASGHGVARLANVYGPGMSPASVLAEIVAQVRADGDLRLRDLTPVRDYVHVSDIARGLVDFALRSERGVVNFGTGSGTSVEQLAKLALAAADQNARKVVSAEPVGLPSVCVLDVSKAAQLLAWGPVVAVGSGITGLVRGGNA